MCVNSNKSPLSEQVTTNGVPKEKESHEEEDEKSAAVSVGPGEHPLQFRYSLWFSRRTAGSKNSATSYEQSIKPIGTFASVGSEKKTKYIN